MAASDSGCHVTPQDEPCFLGASFWGLCALGHPWCPRGSCWGGQGCAQDQPVLTDLLDLQVTAPHRVDFTIGMSGVSLEEHQGWRAREREQWSCTSVPGLAVLAADGAGHGWRRVVGAGCFWLWGGVAFLLFYVSCTWVGSALVGLHLTGPGLTASSSLQKDAPQSPWAATQGPVPPKDMDASPSEQPSGAEPAQSSLSTEEAGAADPTKDPDSPGASSPSNGDQAGDQAQPIPVVKPGTSA